MTTNLAYELTKFSIPDSKPSTRYEPVICPHCQQVDHGAEGYEHTTKCRNCGQLYFIKRQEDDYYNNGERVSKELPF